MNFRLVIAIKILYVSDMGFLKLASAGAALASPIADQDNTTIDLKVESCLSGQPIAVRTADDDLLKVIGIKIGNAYIFEKYENVLPNDKLILEHIKLKAKDLSNQELERLFKSVEKLVKLKMISERTKDKLFTANNYKDLTRILGFASSFGERFAGFEGMDRKVQEFINKEIKKYKISFAKLG